MKCHLGSCPTQQSEGELADGRDHQVHSHGPPPSVHRGSSLLFAKHVTGGVGVGPRLRVCGRLGDPLQVRLRAACALGRVDAFPRTVSCLCVCLLRSSVQSEDGETSLEAVHVGGGPGRTTLRLQVGVSAGFLVQQEALRKEEMTQQKHNCCCTMSLIQILVVIWRHVITKL